MPEFKQGWFTRLARKYLEMEWEERGKQFGDVDRFAARDAAWDTVEHAEMNLDVIKELIQERFNIADVVVLKSNQKKFHKAIVGYRNALRNVPIQQSFPGFEKKVAEHFGPIAHYWVKDPGADRSFSKLKRIGDVDFLMQYQMSQVRDEKQHEVMLSHEDYEFMEARRKAEGLPATTTINQIIARAA